MRHRLEEHVRRYWLIYLTLASIYLAGIVLGAVGVGALGGQETSRLGQFLDTLLLSQPAALSPQFLLALARDTLIIMAGIWLLGLTVVGVPLIYMVVFTRGFILGFTASFLIEVKGAAGVALAVVTIFLPALAAVPLLLLDAGMATIFSFLLLRGRGKGESLRRDFFYYSLSAALVSLGAVLVGIAQGYFSLLGVHLFGL
ncbi:Stage II sporulation protein M [Acididesulfobacillus acetoxydans]|uniref:Stage II sporulation protein M n=1 Tax=Acididesulfobacillus acetoxydans TaxID=1561005 RepID=A0A8S0VXN5_9FIRM|nr:stage II sporulation protein M [Acididesulfobacillus acetoxydans]CAA7602093.1 Stage II sporulation protein M [Acididesulfobacillus acetoxydans]CEJ08064.1 Stage II sporulation protein M [Acididesulfobacillus acetoxydans]